MTTAGLVTFAERFQRVMDENISANGRHDPDDQDPGLDPWEGSTPLEDIERQSFPIAALAPFGPIGPFSLSLSEFTQTPVGLAATTALGTLSAATGNKFEVEVEPGYVEPVNLFILSFLQSGSRKSAVFRAANVPLVA